MLLLLLLLLLLLVFGAGQAVKDTAGSVGQKASSAAAAVKEGLAEARQQLHGATDAATDKARTWFDAVQVCMDPPWTC